MCQSLSESVGITWREIDILGFATYITRKKIIVLHFPVASQRSSEISKDPLRCPKILRDIQRSFLVFYSSINL